MEVLQSLRQVMQLIATDERRSLLKARLAHRALLDRKQLVEDGHRFLPLTLGADDLKLFVHQRR